MGKKKDAAKSGGIKKAAHCGRCKNFDPEKKGGYCRKHDKKRSADDKVCGSFDPR